MIRALVILLLVTLRVFSATLNVGSGQTYSTIGAAMTAASTGDEIVIFPGTYAETVSASGKHNITIRGTDRDSVKIEGGRIEVGGTNWFIHSLWVTNWPGNGQRGINCESSDSLTVSNVVTGDSLTDAWSTTRSHIRARNSGNVKIRNNIVKGVPNLAGSGYQTGIQVVSSKTLGADYAEGTLIEGNDVSDLEGDGVSIHGEWIKVQLNTIYNCLGTNSANHSDGIAHIRSAIDGMTNCYHVIIDRNHVRNTTQNIWVEGWPVGSGNSVGMRDIWITRNVTYMDTGTINGRSMSDAFKPVAIIGGDGVYVYNNYIGLGGTSNGLIIQDSVDRTVLVKGNIIFNPSSNSGTFGIYVETAADVGSGDINYNLYWTTTSNGYLKVGATTMNTLSAMQAQGFEANGIIADPKVNALPTPTLQATSPCIDTSFTPGGSPYWTIDLAGITAPKGAGWDIGAYEYDSGSGGGSPAAVGFSRWIYQTFGRRSGQR